MNLKEKSEVSFFWNAFENAIRLGSNFIVGILLARLLEPEEFGLIGMLAIFISFSNLFIDSGFSQSLIRKRECESKDYSTVFMFNILVSSFCYLILFQTSDQIALFYEKPILSDILKIYGFILFLQGFALVQQTALIKRLNFKYLAKVNIISSILSGFVAILMAYQGFGVWSLVCQQLLRQAILNILLWGNARVGIRFQFDRVLFKEHLGFGFKMLLSGMVYSTSHNIYYLIIGKVFSSQELGFYTRAEQFNRLPSENVTGIISKVTYPLLSEIKDYPEKLLHAYRRLTQHTSFIVFIIMLGLSAMSQNIILVLIGEKWIPAAKYLAIMCFASMLYPLHALNLNILKVKGRSDLFLKIEILKQLPTIPTVIVGAFFGIDVMLYIMVFNSYFWYYLNTYYSGKLIDYGLLKQINDIYPNFLISFGIGFFTYVAKYVSTNIYVSLASQISAFIICTVIVSIITKNKSFFYIFDVLKVIRIKMLRGLRFVKS